MYVHVDELFVDPHGPRIRVIEGSVRILEYSKFHPSWTLVPESQSFEFQTSSTQRVVSVVFNGIMKPCLVLALHSKVSKISKNLYFL